MEYLKQLKKSATGTPPIWNSGSPYPDGSETCPLCSGDGWYKPASEPSDEAITDLLDKLDAYTTAYANQLWRQSNATLTGLPTGIPEQMSEMRAIVKDWIKNGTEQ